MPCAFFAGEPRNALFLCPSVSPWKTVDYHNPAVRLIKYDKSTAVVKVSIEGLSFKKTRFALPDSYFFNNEKSVIKEEH